MTITAGAARSDYLGDGVQTEFAVGFQALEAADLGVYLTNPADPSNPTELVLNTDYTVTGDLYGNQGQINLATPPASGVYVTILRDVVISQSTHYEPYTDFPAASHERALDKLTMIAQSLAEKIERTIQYPVGATGDDIMDSSEFLEALTAARDTAEAAATTATTQAGAAASSAAAAATSVTEAEAAAALAATFIPEVFEGRVSVLESEVVSLDTALDDKVDKSLFTTAWDFIVGSGAATVAKKTAAEVWAYFTSLVGAYTRQQYAVPVVLSAQSGNVSLDADLHQDVFIGCAGNITLTAPANPAFGKTMLITLYSGPARTLTWDTVFKGNADFPTLDTTLPASKRLFLQFRYIDSGYGWILMGRAQEA